MINITIVGGGSAGWMTATTLLNQFPNKKITLVESSNISNIGVGESTVPGINRWLKLVDIDFLDFMPHTDSVFKLSIAFKDWYRKNSGTFHYPFGPSRHQYVKFGTKELHEIELTDWHLKKIFYPETPVSDYAEWFYPSMALINQNKYFPNQSDLDRGELDSEHAYQFDATKFGMWLRDTYCNTNSNFTHILGEVEETPLNDNGIKYLLLDDGRRLEADLFIDCTGFKSVLLSKAFGVPFNSLEKYIPNNYSWATKIPYKDPEIQIVNYTNCTAIANGWIWEIPLWSRMGSGYVFSDKFISTTAALREFKQGLIKKGYENVEDLKYKLIPMRCGVQSKLWVKNTCAIGNAAGFIEPLQSNGLSSTHYFIFNLVRALSRGYVNEWDRQEFTAKCHEDFYAFAAVVTSSYALSHRDDTEYWREIQNREWIPEFFSHDSEGVSKHFYGAYHNKNWRGWHARNDPMHCMTTGMNWNPIDIHSIKYNSSARDNVNFHIKQMEIRKTQWNKQVKDFPTPYQYLKSNIHNV